MRVLHVIPSLSKQDGGPSLAMPLIERSLRGRGIQVETVTTRGAGDGESAGPSGVPVEENGVIRRYFPRTTNTYKTSREFARWIRSSIDEYDLVHIHALFSFTSVVAAKAAIKAHVPYVVRPLGTLNRYGVTQRRPWLKRLSLRLVEGPILRSAAAVHFTSRAEMAEAESLDIPIRGIVIPLGVRQAESSPDRRPGLSRTDGGRLMVDRYPALEGTRWILFLSRLDRKKNVKGLLEAFRRLSASEADEAAAQAGKQDSVAWRNLRLVIAGDGPADYVASLKRLADRLGVSGRVVWTGYLDGELKAAALASADAFVLPSHSENFGIAVVEALFAGLPCVLGKGVALATEVEEAGAGLAVETDPASIARGLTEAMADPQARSGMSGRAVALAGERYTLDAMGKRLAGLYEDVLARTRLEARRAIPQVSEDSGPDQLRRIRR